MQIYNTWNTEEDVEHTVGDIEDCDDKEATTLQKKEYNFQSLNPSLIRNLPKNIVLAYVLSGRFQTISINSFLD